MYKSPIEIIQGQMQTRLDGEILRAVQSVGVNVDKDELIKALANDRMQYEKGYADAMEKQRWISVEDRLPEDWAIVQIVEDSGYKWLPKIGEYRHGLGKWRIEGCFDQTYGWMEAMFRVTHWMPLPEPPKEEHR